jgi:hypothetical protein
LDAAEIEEVRRVIGIGVATVTMRSPRPPFDENARALTPRSVAREPIAVVLPAAVVP